MLRQWSARIARSPGLRDSGRWIPGASASISTSSVADMGLTASFRPSPTSSSSRSTTSGSTGSTLSASQVARFHRDGYILPGFRFEDEAVAAGRAALDDILAKNPDVMPEQLVNSHLEDGEGHAHSVKGNSEFLKLASNPRLVEIVSQCLGTDNVLLYGCQIFCKLPGEGKAVPWHQDGLYHPIKPLRACAAWIALDRSDEENGALKVLPGTHKVEEVPHIHHMDDEAAISYVADPAWAEQKMEEVGMEWFTLDPGEVSFHDIMVVHGSERNRSSRRRAGVSAIYMPAECFFDRDMVTIGESKGGLKLDYKNRPLFVVRGENQHPENTLLRYP